jgi:SHS2 domain-containing protein
MQRYRVFNHTADLGIHVFGKTASEVFQNGAYALFDLITDTELVRPSLERSVLATGKSWDELWVNYLRECLYLFNGEGLLLRDYAILTIDEEQVTVRMRGEAFDPLRHRIKKEIKAVTYHEATLRETPQGWTGRVIFDV